MRITEEQLALYAITDRRWLNGRALKDDVECVLQAGATSLQLREKELDRATFIQEGRELRALCRRYRVPFLINDDVAVALAVDADGVHVGQHDLAASLVREQIGPDKILGVSAQTVEQALRAERAGADYLGVGSVFVTSSKDDADHVDYAELKAICEAVRIPVIAIGGIHAGNAARLSGSGICGIAVISAIFAAPDLAAATRELKEKASQLTGARDGA